MTVDDMFSYAERISKREIIAPQYVHSAWTALINRCRMTAWYRKNELASGEDTTDTQQHEHFTETQDRAFGVLFPETANHVQNDRVAPIPDPAKELFVNSFEPLHDIPTEKASKLTEAEIEQHPESWAESKSKPRSRIVGDPFDEIFTWHSYVLEMDYVTTTVKNYWQMAAKGEMSPALAAWLTSVAYQGIAKICDNYQNTLGLSHTDLITKYMGKKNTMQIEIGEQLSLREAEKSGSQPRIKRFLQRVGFAKPNSSVARLEVQEAGRLCFC